MNLMPIEYKLEDYELPEHLFITGILYIEIDKTDELPYVSGYELTVKKENGKRINEISFYEGQRQKDYAAIEIRHFLHRDKNLMDDIFDECAREGMWG